MMIEFILTCVLVCLVLLGIGYGLLNVSRKRSIANWFRERQEKFADNMADPVRDGKFSIKDSEDLVAKFRKDIAKLMVSNKTLENELLVEQNRVEQWEGVKSRATGDFNDMVRINNELSASKKKTIHLKKIFDSNINMIQKLTQQLAYAESKISEAKDQYSQLVARKKGNEIRRALSESANKLSGSEGPLAELENLKNAVQTEEYELESLDTLGSSNDLLQKYGVDDESIDAAYDKMFK